jgi:ABC-type multidrug transport system ATPase subunit
VPRGVVFALLGENGAGKTTAIRAMLGLGHPEEGTLEVLGLDSRRQGLEIRQRAGCVFEKPTLYELRDGEPTVINYDLKGDVYVVPKVLDQGRLIIGKKRFDFRRQNF